MTLKIAAIGASVVTLAFLAAMFAFGYVAALRPGGPDPEFDAACLSLMGAVVFGVISAGLWSEAE